MRILIIEDNDDLAANIGEFLEESGEVVEYAYDGAVGLELARTLRPDAIVLDIALPRIDGWALSQKLRDEGYAIPILMLTARDTLEDKIEGFAAGADDYLTKPFELRELYMRLQVIVRRNRPKRGRLSWTDLELDLETRQVWRGGRRISVSPVRFRILEALLRKAPGVLTREELQAVIWGDDAPDSSALRVHIHAIRQAIDANSDRKLLTTISGVGYRLGGDDDAAPD